MNALFQQILDAYLVPLLLAVPLAIVVFFIFARRDADTPVRPPPAPAAPPAPAYPLSAFTPLAPPVPAAPPAPAGPAAFAGPAAATAVLVVDDSAVVRAKMRRLLESAGYRVELAEDGEQALDKIARERYSVLITDLEMPRVDGFQVIAQVQGAIETEDLPIIAITGHDELQARVNELQGLYGIFKKPWNDRELLKRIEAVARLRRTSPAR
ncbi:MAG: response regulator [Rubrivivax sp.]|jgi:CheY-like chemotaxis protein|nr:response regulator [Rubrivivax sp.]